MSRCWRRAASAPAMPAATPRSSARTICCPATSRFYEWSLKLWEGLEQDLNYNAMVSQRGVLNLYHSDAQRDAYARRGNAMRLHGVDAELLDRERCARMVPFLDFDNARFPIQGGAAAAARRHGAARCGRLGLCARGRRRAASTSSRTARSPAFVREDGRVVGVETTRGSIRARKVGLAVAGNSSRVAAHGRPAPADRKPRAAGLRVAKAIKPLIDHVVTFGAGHFYISQSDKGGLVFGGDIDGYNSYAQRGNLPTVEDVCEAAWP